MKKSEAHATDGGAGAPAARSPYYALLAELRLRAVEATWSAQAKRAVAQPREHHERSA